MEIRQWVKCMLDKHENSEAIKPALELANNPKYWEAHTGSSRQTGWQD